MHSTTSKRPVKPSVLHPARIASMPPEGFPDPSTGGNVTWKTLMSSEKSATDTFTVGIATCPPGRVMACTASSSSESRPSVPSLCNPESLGDAGFLQLHRHSHAEIYHVISGSGTVCIDQQEYEVNKGSVVFIQRKRGFGMAVRVCCRWIRRYCLSLQCGRCKGEIMSAERRLLMVMVCAGDRRAVIQFGK
jgi:mannose-6-phosphate isomerase-like protein (cupin superfamily)